MRWLVFKGTGDTERAAVDASWTLVQSAPPQWRRIKAGESVSNAVGELITYQEDTAALCQCVQVNYRLPDGKGQAVTCWRENVTVHASNEMMDRLQEIPDNLPVLAPSPWPKVPPAFRE